MDRQTFIDFNKKSYEIVKNNTKHPTQLYKDEMIHFNIVMYDFFKLFYEDNHVSMLSDFAELNYIFNRIILCSNIKDDYDKFMENFVNHYEEIMKSFEDELNPKQLKEAQKKETICIEIMRDVATSSELEGDQHLRIIDMFLLCIIMCEQLGFNLEELIQLTQFAADEIVKMIESMQKEKEEGQDNNN